MDGQPLRPAPNASEALHPRPSAAAGGGIALPPALVFAAANFLLYATSPLIVWRYRWSLGRFPNIARPRRYSERMLWRKLVDHNPQFVTFTDKLAVKEFQRERCPDLPLPRTLWSGADFDAIPQSLLAGDVFVKANHGCGFNHRIYNGQYDRAALRKKTRHWLRSGYGRKNGEWAYSRVAPRLFVEEAVGDARESLLEINIRAGNGRAILGSVMGKCNTPAHWAVYLDPAGGPFPDMLDKDGAPIAHLPESLAVREPYFRAVEFARRLSVGVDYARVDFLWNGSTLYGGEITLYPGAGTYDPFNAMVHELLLHGWDLRDAHFVQSPHRGWARLYASALARELHGIP